MTDVLPSKRVLVIDDQPWVRATIGLALQSTGYELVGVESAAAALIEFEKSHFDIAIVDIFLPGMDGAKLIKELRLRAPRLPVVAISGVQLKASGRTALDFLSMAPNLGQVVCLQKPFRPPQLIEAVHQALNAEAA
jgi:CheY-like chemotaxis protein